jgi:adenylate cyclase
MGAMKYSLHFLLLILLHVSIVPVSGQTPDPEIARLKLIIPSLKYDTNRVNMLIEVSSLYLNDKDNDLAIQYGNQAHALADSLRFIRGMATATKLLGQAYASKSMFQESIEYFNQSLARFRELENKDGISNILNNLGSVYNRTGNDSKSIEYHLQSLTIAEEINDKLRIFTNLNNIGSVYINKAETLSDALNYFQRALPLAEELKNPLYISYVSGNIGEIYFKKGLYRNALPYFERSLEIDKGTVESAYSLGYIGSIYAAQNDFETAFRYLNEAVSISIQEDSKIDLVKSYILQAKAFERKGDVLKTIEAYRNAQPISEEIKTRQETNQIYEGLAIAYSKLGDFKNAYDYESKFTRLKDTLYNTDEAKKIQAMQFSFDIGKKESEIGLLTKQQELQQATIRQARIINIIAAVSGVLLIFMIGGIYNRYKYVRKTNKIIQHERDRSKELLLNILPEETAKELEMMGQAQTRYYEKVTVLFTDFKGFSTIAGKLSPQELVAELNEYFVAFDEIVGEFGLEKIKTIGDAYMCAGGIPTTNTTHPLDAVKAALAMQEFMRRKNAELAANGKQGWELRIGIHTGPIVAGVVGKKKYAYDIWGDTVNIASRMESSGEAGRVNISNSTFNEIKDRYECEHRGKISAKNIGEVDMYFIVRETEAVLA